MIGKSVDKELARIINQLHGTSTSIAETRLSTHAPHKSWVECALTEGYDIYLA